MVPTRWHLARACLVAAAVASPTACAHQDGLQVNVEPIQSQDKDERASVRAIPGGFIADVQFRKTGGAKGPVRVDVRRTTADTIELRLRYRRGNKKCVTDLAYRITVQGLTAGAYQLSVFRQEQVLARAAFDVVHTTADKPLQQVRQVSESGC